MIRCNVCLYPDTRPDADFQDGTCSACRSYEERKNIDWDENLDALLGIISEAKEKGAMYDCVIPVSGGKDSTYQVLKMKELGARVLAVNAATDYLTPLGRENLDNLKNYCDLIEVTPNIDVRKKLVRIGLREIGDLSYPEHMIIWSTPTRIAKQMGIPLVVWGENPQNEYACPEGSVPAKNLDADWAAEFGGYCGLRIDDVIGMDGITEDDMAIYRFPDLTDSDVKGIWLGDYIEWDGWKNAFISNQYGFKFGALPPEGSAANYENLDNYVTVLRDYLRFLKFGYNRATDITSSLVRHKRIHRGEAMRIIEKQEAEPPRTSLEKPIKEVLEHVGLTEGDWVEACEKWRMKK